jgi:hypothetical protein
MPSRGGANLLPLINVPFRRRDASDYRTAPSFMHDRRPPPGEAHAHVGPWVHPSGMIGVPDREKDTSLRARRAAKWHEGSRQCA